MSKFEVLDWLIALLVLALLVLALVGVVGCGPAWSEVRVHSNGVIEDPGARECWTPDLVPVRCPLQPEAPAAGTELR